MLAVAAREAGGYSKAEDSSFFASVIPLQVHAAHAQQHGGTQHMRVHVPDITLQLDAERGMELVEVKSVSFCPT